MLSLVKIISRTGFVLIAAMIAFATDVTVVYAQSSSCSRLQSTLRTFDRNRDFQSLERNSRQGQALAQDVQDAESNYVRGGCQAQQQAGQQLSRQCRQLARQILSGRADRDKLAQSVETGNSVSQQREAVLQEIARFGCGSGSTVTFQNQEVGRPRQSIFDRMFGDHADQQDQQFTEEDVIGDEFSGYGGYTTVRTVCVRLSDGYFWPVSYSTLIDYAPNDANQCVAQCPNTPVDLYYYDNPGQEPEQMVNLNGQPYTALPNAFRYLKAIDTTNSCKAKTDFGSISIADTEHGQSRAVIAFGDLNFPLPMRDPRQQQVVEVLAVNNTPAMDIPLPRRRPTAPGMPVQQVAEPASNDQPRVATFGDKKVRIVGPETPYGRLAGAGT